MKIRNISKAFHPGSPLVIQLRICSFNNQSQHYSGKGSISKWKLFSYNSENPVEIEKDTEGILIVKSGKVLAS